jgi:hypothetical protein
MILQRDEVRDEQFKTSLDLTVLELLRPRAMHGVMHYYYLDAERKFGILLIP